MQLGRLGNWLACCFGAWVAGMLATLAPPEAAAFGQMLVSAAYAATIFVVVWWALTQQATKAWARRIISSVASVEPWHLQLIGLVGVIVFACIALAGMFWERYYWTPRAAPAKTAIASASALEADGPLTWEFGSSNSPVGTSRSAGAPLWVDAFQIKGQNTSDGPIHARKAAVRSDMTGRIIPLLFSHGGVLVEPNTVTIAPEGRFILIGRIPPTDPSKSLGVVVDQFREEFGAFTFTFEYGDPNYYYGDQTTYTRRFPWAEVDKILTNVDVQSRRPNDRAIIIRKPPHYARTPDYDKWDAQNVLRLFEAACLWNDEEPSLPMSATSLQTFWEFYKAIYERRLGTKANLDDALKIGMAQTGWPREPNEDDPVNVNTKVSRQHLKPYAEKAGVKPKFLYPDQRAGKRPA